jgi:hypothetical protein
MSTNDAQLRSTMLAQLAGELERGAGSHAQIARRLGPDRTEKEVQAALAEIFSNGVRAQPPDRVLRVT